MELQQLLAQRMKGSEPSFIREILKAAQDPGMISFAGGLPNEQTFPVAPLQAVATHVLGAEYAGSPLQYAPTEGLESLRAWIAHRYNHRFKLKLSHKNILITTGSQQGLDLIAKTFLNPHDKVLMEGPGYLGAHQILKLFQAETIEVPLDEQGPEPEAFHEYVTRNQPKLTYLIPNFQNPTGCRYSAYRRKRLAHSLKRSGGLLVEDDPYGELFFDGEDLPPISKYLGEQAILLGSFSKVLAPGLRLGWVVASEGIIQLLTQVKQAADLHSSSLSQHISYRYLRDFNYENHLQELRKFYKGRRNLMDYYLSSQLGDKAEWKVPEGGMFYWVRLPGINARELLALSEAHRVLFVPGEVFSSQSEFGDCIRLNFSNATREEMEVGIKRLAEAVKQLLETCCAEVA